MHDIWCPEILDAIIVSECCKSWLTCSYWALEGCNRHFCWMLCNLEFRANLKFPRWSLGFVWCDSDPRGSCKNRVYGAPPHSSRPIKRGTRLHLVACAANFRCLYIRTTSTSTSIAASSACNYTADAIAVHNWTAAATAVHMLSAAATAVHMLRVLVICRCEWYWINTLEIHSIIPHCW